MRGVDVGSQSADAIKFNFMKRSRTGNETSGLG
jgi:hypothetical protein